MTGPPPAVVGVFDSGVGGLSVLRALRAALPNQHFVYFADTAHAPYGEQAPDAIAARSLAVAEGLVKAHGIGALVVACNTATACAVDALRVRWPTMPVVGVEPAIKPGALHTRTGHVAVMATRATVESARFARLRTTVEAAHAVHLHPVACDGLAQAIEDANAMQIIALCQAYTLATGQFGSKPGQIDTLVLGCTHYPFAGAQLQHLLGDDVRLIDSGDAVARQTAQRLADAQLLAPRGIAAGNLTLEASAGLDRLAAFAARVL